MQLTWQWVFIYIIHIANLKGALQHIRYKDRQPGKQTGEQIAGTEILGKKFREQNCRENIAGGKLPGPEKNVSVHRHICFSENQDPVNNCGTSALCLGLIILWSLIF